MKDYEGYWLEINGVKFNNPHPIKDTFKFAPRLVQVGDSSVLASGKLSTKVLPHDRSKLWCEFPPMTVEQAEAYRNAIFGGTGGHGMFSTIKVYDIISGEYFTDTYYHTDIEWTPVYLGGKWLVKLEPFDLIGH